jgi:ActD protein
MSAARLHGLMAEFTSAERLIAAAAAARARGYRAMDAYTPFPVDGLGEALGLPPSRMPLLILLGGIAGCLGGYGLQYWAMVASYPINTGGRPLNSWPSFIPVTFELTILCAALTAVFGMILMNGLPMPYHPVFNVRRFSLASRSRFFLCIEARDPSFSAEECRRFLHELSPEGVYDVEA